MVGSVTEAPTTFLPSDAVWQILGVMWVLAKALWPLWIALIALVVFRITLERLVDRLRAKREARREVRGLMSTAISQHSGSHERSGLASSIEALTSMRDAGVLSHAEWLRAKDVVLDARGHTVATIRQLHDLYKSGALSESEFNSRKWEILSSR